MKADLPSNESFTVENTFNVEDSPMESRQTPAFNVQISVQIDTTTPIAEPENNFEEEDDPFDHLDLHEELMAGNLLAHEIIEEMKQGNDEYDEDIWELFSSDEENPLEESKEPKMQKTESEKPTKRRRNTVQDLPLAKTKSQPIKKEKKFDERTRHQTMTAMDWDDDLWTQETVDDWEPDNDPEELDLLAADALFDMIINGMDMTSERMRSTVVLMQTQSNDSRASKILNDGELNEVVDGIGYVDPKTDAEMKEMIAEIISAITTGDEDEDMQSIDIFAQSISA